ncbi:exported hypothetical protein [Candidatus Nitrospira nitrificans]|uniref:Uncharacterized protein n=1 Tax=Candidatus Nitrospira nitrificans TaxID=1742973 RepID=A0A0S4LUC4_9BACT|nr:hypothetical protein [Candidatus Nitrospira nitrificans]CUS39462.1 exported hypothetical protein [Candidatus Nitrospira nitrificans]
MRVPKKLSTLALSQQLPLRLMLTVMPCVMGAMQQAVPTRSGIDLLLL